MAIAYQTPFAEFHKSWSVYRFTVDAAAADENAKVRPHLPTCIASEPRKEPGDRCRFCGVYVGRYYTAETNGLDGNHYQTGDRVWANPPYDGSIIKWVKLGRELSRDLGVLWRYLLPPGTDTRWFHRYVWDNRLNRPREGVILECPDYRIHFIHPVTKKDSPRNSNLYVTFLPEVVDAKA